MEKQSPWVKFFLPDAARLTKLIQELPQNCTLLEYCLQQKIFAEADYLQWASQELGLPVLGAEFFQRSADADFWNMIKTQYSWRPDLLPLGQWDDVLFIGCLEKPDVFNFPKPIAFVLVPSAFLQKRWTEYITLITPGAQALAPAPLPLPSDNFTHTAMTGATANAMIDTKSEPTFNSETVDEMTSSKISFEMPDGFALQTPAIKFDFSAVKNSTPSDEMPDGLPDGFKASVPPIPPLRVPSRPTLNLQPSSALKIAVPEFPPIPLEAEMLPEITQTQSKILETNFGSHPDLALTPEALSPPAAKPELPPVAPVIALMPTAKPEGPSGAGRALDDVGKMAFDRMASYFQKSMLLIVENNEAKPVLWSKDFQVLDSSAMQKSFSLGEPGIFRIAFDTHLPYHGRVVASPVNTEFFKTWNANQLPQHVTVMPVMLSDQVLGFLMGQTNSPIDGPAVLTQMTVLTNEVSKIVSTLPLDRAA
jgi:hypothetical protein